MKLISACLCGINCKYDGKSNYHPLFVELFKKGEVIPVCPEQLGGLTTPRTPSEIKNGTGIDVLYNNKTKVITKDTKDVTAKFIKGAYETLNIAKLLDIDTAIFKSRSPSCGMGNVYDGSFSGKLIKGDGVTTALLKENKINVINNEEYNNKEWSK
ncbi:DUF523 domain-containing protein [Candidatus Syntrophocurvum alkaliphilum]|uniref:DUF523 domain-containing protein n=1 Tax=Candidatus Syntrophocurvum alkaliphilum TaxID=2293317 RepID=UPI0012E24861|nr:DUF523 domain-containing protein [Candidatus Syntrophocurvum alkaliphilum]